MTDQRTTDSSTSRMGYGFIVFAGVMMIMTGAFQALVGIVGVFHDDFYLSTRNYVFELDPTTWGWVHMLLGIVVALAGLAVLMGQTWGRVVGILLALGSALTNFAFLPYYPFWSMLVIALDVLVIWALAAHGRDFETEAVR